MGFVDDESDSEVDSVLVEDYVTDEEAAAGKESASFPSSRRQRPNEYSSPNNPRTPTTKNNDLLAVTRLRRKGITESEEIWEELEDEGADKMSEFAPVSPYYNHRVASARTTPATSHRNSKVLFSENENGLPSTETTGLLARSGTGRSYRDKRRRQSLPMLSIDTAQIRRRSAGSQEALGGWWKMKWWQGGDSKGKGKDEHVKGGYREENGGRRESA